jgi:hypothetical protein
MKRLHIGPLCFIAIVLITLNIPSAISQTLDELVGEWITRGGPQNGARLEIRRNYDTHDSVFGQGRIARTVEWAANYVIVYPGNTKCYFYISLSNNNSEMNVEVKSPGTKSEDECIRGYFVKRSDSGAAPRSQSLSQINDVLSKRVGFSLRAKLADNRTVNLVHVSNSVISGDFYRFDYSLNSNSKVTIGVHVDKERTIKAISLEDNYYDDVNNEVLKRLYVRMLTDWNHGRLPVFTSSTNRQRYNFEYARTVLDVKDGTWSLDGVVYGYLRQHVWYDLDPTEKGCGGRTAPAEAPRCDSFGRYAPWAAPPNQIDRETIWIAVPD